MPDFTRSVKKRSNDQKYILIRQKSTKDLITLAKRGEKTKFMSLFVEKREEIIKRWLKISPPPLKYSQTYKVVGGLPTTTQIC